TPSLKPSRRALASGENTEGIEGEELVMSETTPAGAERFHKGTVPLGPGTWLLVAGFAYLAIGTILTSRPGAAITTPGSTTILMVLATLTGAAGAVALLRTPSAPPTRPFV